MGIFDKDTKCPIFINLDTGEIGGYITHKPTGTPGFNDLMVKPLNALFGEVTLVNKNAKHLHTVQVPKNSLLSVNEIKFYFDPNNPDSLFSSQLNNTAQQEKEKLRREVTRLQRQVSELERENESLRKNAHDVIDKYQGMGKKRTEYPTGFPPHERTTPNGFGLE